MSAFIGLVHMFKAYDPDRLRNWHRHLRTCLRRTRSLVSMERAASYAVPIMQSGLEGDPLEMIAAWHRNGPCWRHQYKERHMAARVRCAGIADRQGGARCGAQKVRVDRRPEGRPTWLNATGKPDMEKLLFIGGTAAAAIPLTERVGVRKVCIRPAGLWRIQCVGRSEGARANSRTARGDGFRRPKNRYANWGRSTGKLTAAKVSASNAGIQCRDAETWATRRRQRQHPP